MSKKPIEKISSISLNEIEIEENIRLDYDEKGIDELARSLNEVGQLHPIRVFKREEKFIIICGHRRYLAAIKASLEKLNCIVIDEPSKKEKKYLQISENEQSESMKFIERELYIKELLDLGETFEQIAKRASKSTAWMRACFSAYKIRQKFQHIIDKYKIDFTTKEINCFANVNEEILIKTIENINKNPENRKLLLDDIKLQYKKKNSGKKPKANISENKKPKLENLSIHYENGEIYFNNDTVLFAFIDDKIEPYLLSMSTELYKINNSELKEYLDKINHYFNL